MASPSVPKSSRPAFLSPWETLTTPTEIKRPVGSIYGGPGSNEARETFTTPHQFTEYGFLVVRMDSRSAGGRGKDFLDAIYMKLGVVEVDD